jgi:hypothetical protein
MSLISAWHDLLTDEVAEDTHRHIESELQRRGLVFDGRALCTVLRPRLTTPDELAGLQRRIRPLLRAFARAHERARQDAAFRAQFGLLYWEETLLASDTGYSVPSPTSRLDFFYVPASGALALTEYNAETPAGAAYSDALSEVFLDTRAMREFTKTWDVLSIPARHGVVGAVLEAWREFSRSGTRPRIAILDWDDVATRTEFELYRQHFAAMGLDAVIDDPRRCEYRGGKLWSYGAPVDLIYKRVLIAELIETCGMEHDVVRAVRERAVCMVDGFHCKVLHKKASLAVLSDESNAALFDAGEQAAIRDCIPWTRVVHERRTTYGGAPVDLIPFIAGAKDRMVLKPNDDYGGAGITLGWTVDESAWEAAVRQALQAPHIVQERVAIPSEPYPSWVDGRVQIIDRMLDTAPFISNGAYMEGLLTRLSTAALLNVTAGGGSTVPAFAVQPRT